MGTPAVGASAPRAPNWAPAVAAAFDGAAATAHASDGAPAEAAGLHRTTAAAVTRLQQLRVKKVTINATIKKGSDTAPCTRRQDQQI